MVAQIDREYIRSSPLKALTRLVSYAIFEGRPLTTRGQWINPVLMGLFSLEKRLPALKEIKNPVFIVGTGRSGTTALGVVLSLHRQIGFLNEPKALWHAIYPDEDLIGSYSRGLAKYRLSANMVTNEIKQNAQRLFGSYLFLTGTKRLLDKYPELVFRIPFVRAIFPDAKFLFLVRNGWDTCRSIESWSDRLGVQSKCETHDWWGSNSRKWQLLVDQVATEDVHFDSVIEQISAIRSQNDKAALEWILSMREGLEMLERYPEHVHLIRYEDLTSQPDMTLSEILEFCELPQDDILLSYAKRTLRPASHHGSFDLHPALRSSFEKVMKQLGYE